MLLRIFQGRLQMPRRKSTGLTDRSVVNHGQNGKGDASRITDIKAFRANYDLINWSGDSANRRTLEELRDEYEFRHGL